VTHASFAWGLWDVADDNKYHNLPLYTVYMHRLDLDQLLNRCKMP